MLRNATLNDLNSIKKIFDNGIGENFYSEDELRAFITTPRDVLVLVNVDDGAIGGCMYNFISTLEKGMEALHIPKTMPPFADMDMSLKVGVLKTASTDYGHRHRGIGMELVSGSARELSRMGISYLLACSLRTPEGKAVTGGILETIGLSAVCELKTPWINVDCYCPMCKSRFCHCDGVIYMKPVS